MTSLPAFRAMTSDASKQELLKQMEKIVEGVKQNLEKVHVNFQLTKVQLHCVTS